LVIALGLIIWWVFQTQANQTSTVPTETTAAQTVAPTHAVAVSPTLRSTVTPTLVPLTPTSAPTRTPPPSPSAAPTLGVGARITSPVDGMLQVYVPAGEFLMGSHIDADRNAVRDEKPQRTVRVDAFWIDRTEVTNAAYALCVEDNQCPPPRQLHSTTRTTYYADPQFADYPVIYVSWYDARTYCQWVQRRLPTEAEWEKAARGTAGQIYPWPTVPLEGSLLNFDNRIGDTTAVGRYFAGASPYGALDLAGNVWEWVADWYRSDYYATAPDANPLGPEVGSLKTYRGGAWDEPGWSVRAATRASGIPDQVYPDVGFRCAADAP
jgi:formylglycine-generating enzyme required for sulfatase activity